MINEHQDPTSHTPDWQAPLDETNADLGERIDTPQDPATALSYTEARVAALLQDETLIDPDTAERLERGPSVAPRTSQWQRASTADDTRGTQHQGA